MYFIVYKYVNDSTVLNTVESKHPLDWLLEYNNIILNNSNKTNRRIILWYKRIDSDCYSELLNKYGLNEMEL